jgi:hypothetical protein
MDLGEILIGWGRRLGFDVGAAASAFQNERIKFCDISTILRAFGVERMVVVGDRWVMLHRPQFFGRIVR